MICKYPTLRITEIIHALNEGLVSMTIYEAAKLISEAADIIRDNKLGNNFQFTAEHLYGNADEIRKAAHLAAAQDIVIPSRIFIEDYFRQLQTAN